MHPVILKLGWFSVYSFGFMLALSFLLGIYLSGRRAKDYGVAPEHVLDLSVYVIVSGVLGSRLLYVAFHLDEYRNFVDIFALWQGGATLYGGFLLAILAGYVFSRKKHLGFLVLGDIISPALALGISLTRVGCFLSGCCFGRGTTLPWSVTFPPDSPAGAYERGLAAAEGTRSVALHPSQLYDSLLAFATFLLLVALRKRLARKNGMAFGLMLLCYGVSRFIVDFTRYYEKNMMVTASINLNQVISGALVVIGAYLLFRRSKERSPAGAKSRA